MTDLEKLVDKLEYMYSDKIITSLEQETLSVDKAAEFAQAFLDLEPFESEEDVKTKITELVSVYPQFSFLKDYVLAYDQEKRKDAVIERMRAHLKNKDVDEALRVAQSK